MAGCIIYTISAIGGAASGVIEVGFMYCIHVCRCVRRPVGHFQTPPSAEARETRGGD